MTAYYDNEHSSSSTFYHNGTEYYYYESKDKDFYSTILWYENGYSFSIFAHLSKEEIIKIAENLEKYNFFDVIFISAWYYL